MSVRMVALGWDWYPYGYRRVAADGAPVKAFPPELARLARGAVDAAYGEAVDAIAGAAGYEPDIAIVNHYPHGAKMGLHQDRDERTDAPVVSLSLGDTCLFRLGNTRTRTRPWTDLELRSGDLLVFGGPARFAYHGVVRTLPGTADPALGLTGRLQHHRPPVGSVTAALSASVCGAFGVRAVLAVSVWGAGGAPLRCWRCPVAALAVPRLRCSRCPGGAPTSACSKRWVLVRVNRWRGAGSRGMPWLAEGFDWAGEFDRTGVGSRAGISVRVGHPERKRTHGYPCRRTRRAAGP